MISSLFMLSGQVLDLTEGDAGVMAAEAQGIGNGHADRALHRLQRRVVQVAGRIGMDEADGRRNDAVAQRQRGGQQFHGAGGTDHVAGHRLGAADRRAVRIRLAEGELDGRRLRRIIELRTRTVRVDVEVLAGLVAGLDQRVVDGPGLSHALPTPSEYPPSYRS